MYFIRLINEAPLLLVMLVVVALFELYSIGLIVLCRRIWGQDRLRQNNEVGGLKFAAIGVLYAVLLGFVVIAVWEDYQNTGAAVRSEAKGLRDLLHLSYALTEEGELVRKQLVAYADHVRQDEWPEMAAGTLASRPADQLAHLEETILGLKVDDLRALALYQEALRLLAVVQDSRSERLESAGGSIPPILWLVLLTGALILLGYPAFFGTPNLDAQIAMASVMAALVALVLLPALLLNYPFTGPVSLSSAPFAAAVAGAPPHTAGHEPGEAASAR